MGIFSREPAYCTVCKKKLTHKHKPRREWCIKGPLCGDCHVDKAKEYYEGKIKQPCLECGTIRKITDLWEPRWQWDMEGLLCKGCFDKKEAGFERKKNYCSICDRKLGRIRHRPKPKWKIDGELCRECWDSHKMRLG